MRKLLFIGLIFILFLSLNAQEQSPYKYTDINAETLSSTGQIQSSAPFGSPSVIARISFFAPMFLLEFAPADFFVFSTGIRIWPTFWEENEEGQSIYSPSLNPHMTLEPRFFFTQAQRRQSGRRTDYYSGWYFGLPFAMNFPELDFSMGTVLGFQCTFGKNGYWNASLGPAASYQDASFKMIATGTAAFGLILD